MYFETGFQTINGIKYEAILFQNTKLCKENGFRLPVPETDEMHDFLTNFAPSGVDREIHFRIEMEAS